MIKTSRSTQPEQLKTWLSSAFVLLGLSVAACDCGSEGPGLGRLQSEIFLEQTSLDFGEVPLGARKDLPIKVENRGQRELVVCVAQPAQGQMADMACMTLSKVEPDGAPFAPVFEGTTDTGTWEVDSTAAREMIVSFSPVAEGAIEAKLTLVHNARNGPTSEITLRGSGVRPQVDVSTTVIDFGEVAVGQRKEVDLTLTNRTQFAQPVNLGPIQQTAVIFGTGDGRVDVAGNGTATVKVWFEPVDEGQATATLPVAICPTCVTEVMLLGQGVKPAFEVDPVELNYGSLEEGAMASRSFSIRNIGNSALTIERVELEAGTTSEYTIVGGAALAGAMLPAGASVAVEVTYQGSTPGMDNGRVMVVANAWDNPATGDDERMRFVNLVAVSNGPDINALPAAVNFGTVAIMGAGATQNLLLENQGNSPLTIRSISLNSPTAELSIANAPGIPATVDPGASVQVTLRYSPQDAGVDEAQFVVDSDDRDENPLVITVRGIGGVPTTCAVGVAPPNVNFGLVERGRQATLPIQVRNSGAQPCTISNVRISGDPSFTTPAAGVGATVAPGSSARIDVQYQPPAYGMHSGTLQFDADDPAQPTVSVALVGSSAPSDVRVIPSQLDFAVVPVTCRSPNRAITIYNTGNNAITINRVYLDPSTSPEFELQPFPTPSSVPAGASVVINMRYHPADIGSDNGVLFIEHSAAGVPVAVPLIGRGEVSPTVTDRFTQLPTPMADVLFVVDNSCSMDDEQVNLGRNLGSFLTYAQQEGIDYQIGVVTTDVDSASGAGRLVSRAGTKIITPMTPNASSVFQQNTALGTSGSGQEQGLEAAYLALSDPRINDPAINGGFLRTDAALAVILVSDEEDQSRRQVSFYENFFRNIKGFQNTSQFSFSAIVVPSNPPCSGGGASAGSRYIAVAQSTGGVVESICTANWGNTLANIGLNTFGLRRRFNLSSQPVPSTIAVKVDGMQVQSVTPGGQARWRYDQATNAVVFESSATPMSNSVIEITYTVACLP
jgi:hypothetical protein